ncbi:PREDICTED: sulfate transporter 1.3-like [Erythranthe guttata]|uniref:sulfate transporter 1.3-like n=1 Tax=Erythranthe guttata TaxID=4155 RepID=UPI00064DA95D|nr:PREDICTED: sulfate transporter 1.3-like [Erythranthe guttata]|eukprot:XP_012828278.1 PREDICTED: sulfate transporter 1.3-like [Erythranthe guttata]
MSGNGVLVDDEASAISSHRHANEKPYVVYKVGAPNPKQSFFKEFKFTLKETFFNDDPFRAFKNQSKLRKLLLGIEAVFPIVDWGRKYKLSMFKGDLISGLTIATLCIPQDIGYARLANLDPQFGLLLIYRSLWCNAKLHADSSFVPPLIYAMMGSSRDIAIGPVAVVSLLLGTLLQSEIDHTTHKHEYQRLAFTATFFAGVTQFVLGFFRLGFLIDFLSHAAIVGFMAGAAITISLQQLKSLLGINVFTKKTDVVSVMKSVWTNVHHGVRNWNWETILIGVTFLIFLLLAKYIGKKSKKLFWIPAIAPLISVIVSTSCVYITHAERRGVKIVGSFEKGINPPSLHEIHFTGSYMMKGLRIGVVAGMIALTEAVAIGRTFAAMKDYHLDGNREMVALGTMNVVGSMTSCYVATGYTTAYEEEDRINEDNRERIRFLIVELSPVTDIDTSGIHALEDLYKSLQKRDIQLVVANPGQVVLDKLHSSGFVKTVGEDAVFMTVGDAVFTLGHISEP